jgi:hypothetical protein
MTLPAVTSENVGALAQPIPIESATWNQSGPASIPTLVLQLDASPFASNDMSVRNVAVNIANATNSGANLFVQSSIGVPGLEYVSTPYMLAPPILKASTNNDKYVLASFAAPSFAQPGLSLVLQTVPLP